MNRTKIEFCDYVWNPIVGCRNHCSYCWARKFNNRFFKYDFDTPKFFPERLEEKIPSLPRKRNRIAAEISPDRPVVFVVDMGDIFSIGVKDEWIEKILLYVKKNRKLATFLFLTKDPWAFGYWLFECNICSGDDILLGTSIDYGNIVAYNRVGFLQNLKKFGFRTFVNIEPIMGTMDEVYFDDIDFVIVGALTGYKDYQPERSWHKSIRHPKIYYKDNYLKYFPELINH